MRKHENGKEYVVLYFNNESGELVKEEVYFSNGKLQWTGNYKKNLENGTWKFYFESGKIKSEETYLNGKEHGTSIEYDEKGKKIKESYWKHGKLIKEIKY
jgi:antitoxin component YwqK of YwqJK toxin-antitoxin module